MKELFIWPAALLLLGLVPVLFWVYLRKSKLPARASVYYPGSSLFTQLSGRGTLYRHLPALVYLGACLFAFVALARPTYPVPEANPQAAIILALDVSRSMQARDILPNRFEAARAAVKAFIGGLPAGTRVGLITFSGYTTQVSPPTDDYDRLLAAVDALQMDFGTVIGEALLTSLQALPSLEQREAVSDDPQSLATIVLLTDGRNFGGVDPLVALEQVKKQKVTVHTVGVGSLGDGPIPGIPLQYQFAARFDEPTLRTLAEETGGDYVFVESAQTLRQVYEELGRSLVWRYRPEEVTALAALAAALCFFFSLTGSSYRRKVV